MINRVAVSVSWVVPGSATRQDSSTGSQLTLSYSFILPIYLRKQTCRLSSLRKWQELHKSVTPERSLNINGMLSKYGRSLQIFLQKAKSCALITTNSCKKCSLKDLFLMWHTAIRMIREMTLRQWGDLTEDEHLSTFCLLLLLHSCFSFCSLYLWTSFPSEMIKLFPCFIFFLIRDCS